MTMRVPEKKAGLSVPEYRRQSGYTAGSGLSARADDAFVEIRARAEEDEREAAGRFAVTAGRAVMTAAQAWDDYQTSRATQAFNAFQTSMQERMYGEDGIFTRQGEAAFSSAEDLETAMRESVQGLSESMDLNPLARVKLARQVFAFGNQALPRARKYAADQRLNWANGQDRASIELNQEAFLNNADDSDARMLNLNTMRESYERYAARNGLSEEEKTLGWKKIQSGAYGRLADKYISEGNLSAARRLAGEEALWMDGEQSRLWAKITRQEDILRAQAEAQRQEEEREAEDAFIESSYQDVMSGINKLPVTLSVEERKAKLVQFTAGMEPKLRAVIRRRGEADIDERELVRKAGIIEELGLVDRMRRANPDASSNKMIRIIRESNLSEEAKAAGIKELEKEREGAGNAELSAAGLREFRAAYDARNGDMSDTEARALIFDLNLNAKDREAALAYPGRGMEYSQARIDGLITSVLGKDTSGKNRSDIYAALMKRIPEGESWDDRRIRAEIYNLSQREHGSFGNSFAGLILKNEGRRFRPDIPEAMRNTLNSELEQDYPFFSSLPEKTRQLMRQGLWLRRQYGIVPEWTEEELKLLKSAGGK